MAVAIIMPRQGQSVESCIITEWNKKEGDQVNEGDVLFSYETDKASFEEEAKASGTLLKILAEEGDDVPCLENVAILGEPGKIFQLSWLQSLKKNLKLRRSRKKRQTRMRSVPYPLAALRKATV